MASSYALPQTPTGKRILHQHHRSLGPYDFPATDLSPVSRNLSDDKSILAGPSSESHPLQPHRDPPRLPLNHHIEAEYHQHSHDRVYAAVAPRATDIPAPQRITHSEPWGSPHHHPSSSQPHSQFERNRFSVSDDLQKGPHVYDHKLPPSSHEQSDFVTTPVRAMYSACAEIAERQMKSRTRGNSDLARPASVRYTSSPTAAAFISQVVANLAVPLPYILASAAYATWPTFRAGLTPISPYSLSTLEDENGARLVRQGSGLIEACTLTSGTLLLVGILAKIRSSERMIDHQKERADAASHFRGTLSRASVQTMALRALGVAFPFYAASQLGGFRVGLILNMCIASNLTLLDPSPRKTADSWYNTLTSNRGILGLICLSMFLDLSGFTYMSPSRNTLLGYLALFFAMLFLPLPLPISAIGPGASQSRQHLAQFASSSPLVGSVHDVNLTLISGITMSVVTLILALLLAASPPVSITSICFSTLALAASAAAIIFAQPLSLRHEPKTGLGISCFIMAAVAFLFSPSIWPGTILNGGLTALSFLSVMLDTAGRKQQHSNDKRLDNHSAFTSFVMSYYEPGSLIYGILDEKDSRRIAYFTILNFAFMIVQGIYGYLSGSLGLLSDTVHMFFDCLGLIVGLGAAVASKWPTSPEKPYGWGKLNTLAGFGNGIFLMLVSVEFIFEAIEGILERKELRHVQELFIVSTLGLLVNLVGLFAFGHAHAGHDHGHSHGDGHGHHHHHENENMHGIFLHVAADAGGSLAVIFSTALTLWKPWYLWDPLATILIAILIFAAAVPLVSSSGQKLLLVIPDNVEHEIKLALQELAMLRGVVSCSAPKLWIDDREIVFSAHDHGSHLHHHATHIHHHEHQHAHTFSHSSEHGHDHAHGPPNHNHNHDYDQHSHNHDHNRVHSHHDGDAHHHHDHHDHQHHHYHLQDDHDHDHDHHESHQHSSKIMGVIHIIAAVAADLEDVRDRVQEFAREHHMDLIIHVERESDTTC